jgi:hypothetical protein
MSEGTRFPSWWLLGGLVLSLATIIKLIRTVLIGAVAAGQAGWTEALSFAVAIFGMGFLCGLVIWAGRGLSRRLGLVGDAIVGMVVMLVFFTACMLLFDPALLGPGGLPMFVFGGLLGLVSEAWFGRNLRKEWAKQESEPWRHGDEDEDFDEDERE